MGTTFGSLVLAGTIYTGQRRYTGTWDAEGTWVGVPYDGTTSWNALIWFGTTFASVNGIMPYQILHDATIKFNQKYSEESNNAYDRGDWSYGQLCDGTLTLGSNAHGTVSGVAGI